MPECEIIGSCIFFLDQMLGMPSMADILKHRYCKGDFEACARYMIFKALSREKVPPDLFPNQRDKVKGILRGEEEP